MWRDSGRRVRFWKFDAYLVFFILLFLIGFNMTTLIIVAIAFIVFYSLEYKGYNIPNAIRKILLTVAGRKKVGVHWWRQKNLWY